MITAVDTNILIDVVGADPQLGTSSRAALEESARRGTLVVGPEVVAEFTTGCGSATVAFDLLRALKITYVDTGITAAGLAGEVRSRSSTRTRITADYLVGSHAVIHADCLLTRDFDLAGLNLPGLQVVTPEELTWD